MTAWRAWIKRMPVETAGMLLGFIGVAGFSLTLPATRVAVSHLDPTLVGLGRSLVAAVFAAVLLVCTRQARPSRSQFKSLLVVVVGVIIGFPLLSSWAMRDLPAAHAAIVVAVLPLLTVAANALRTGDRPALGFWLVSIAGSGVVLVFVMTSGSGGLQTADLLLLAAAALGAVGYAEGGRLARTLGGWQVICWALLVAAPIIVAPVGFAFYQHGASAPPHSWLGFLYIALISQLLAFFFWYQGLALGGVARVSQVQLLQPFLTITASAMLFDEHITPRIAGFALAVVVLVAIGRKMSTGVIMPHKTSP